MMSNAGAARGNPLASYFREFGALRHCGREFWVVQLVNLLDGVAYFAMLTVSTLYLSETLGYDDAKAANIWAACMAIYTGVGFVAGFVGDSLGIKRTLYISVMLLIASRLVLSVTEVKAIVLPALAVIMVGTAIMTPILISATKRYTTPESQTAGFNMLYLLMNIGAFLGNWTLDPLRALPWGNRTIFMVGSAMSILCWLSILLFWRRGISKVDTAARPSGTGANDKKDDEKWEAPWTIAASVMKESAFWRFMLFLVILVGVRLVFEHQYQVYPKYYQRTMSEHLFDAPVGLQVALDAAGAPLSEKEADADSVAQLAPVADFFAAHEIALTQSATVKIEKPGVRWLITDTELRRTFSVSRVDDGLRVYNADVPIGKYNSINPLIICFGVIISTPIVARYKLFNVMFFGITISSLSMIFLVLNPVWFCGYFGWTLAQGYTVIAVLQITVFSIGEVIWSPRLYEYTAAIAPEGREASYMGLSYFPMFAARFSEGPLAGWLLTKYCPPGTADVLETVPYSQGPQFMHLILAGIAITTPVLILVFRGVIQKESRLDKAVGLSA